MWESALWVDNGAHLLHFGGCTFPCDRDVEALAVWNGHALLLSSDTDCLSLWDEDGCIRTARVGVYPQDMAVRADTACICGGTDGKVHLLSLPDLQALAEFPVPGMPERICIHGKSAHLLSLLTDPDVETVLLSLELSTGKQAEIARFGGIPGALAADATGLWVGVSEQVLHMPWGTDQADTVIEGISLARRIEVQEGGLLIEDALEGRTASLRTSPTR